MSRKKNVPLAEPHWTDVNITYFQAHKFDIFAVVRGNVGAIRRIQELPSTKLAIKQKGATLRWGDVFPSATMFCERSIHEILEIAGEERRLKHLLDAHKLWRIYRASDDLTILDGFNALSEHIPSFEPYFTQCMAFKRRLTKENAAVHFLDLLWICNTQISIITFYATLNAAIPGGVDLADRLEKCLKKLDALFKAFLANIK